MCFDFSAKYDFNPDRLPGALDVGHKNYDPNDPQLDRNKLFGIRTSFFSTKNSARFGWYYHPTKGRFIISAYCHVNGSTHFEDICELVAGKMYDLNLQVADRRYVFSVYKVDSGERLCYRMLIAGKINKIGFLLGLYFGGDRTAPQSITIQIKK